MLNVSSSIAMREGFDDGCLSVFVVMCGAWGYVGGVFALFSTYAVPSQPVILPHVVLYIVLSTLMLLSHHKISLKSTHHPILRFMPFPYHVLLPHVLYIIFSPS